MAVNKQDLAKLDAWHHVQNIATSVVHLTTFASSVELEHAVDFLIVMRDEVGGEDNDEHQILNSLIQTFNKKAEEAREDERV